MMGRVYSGESNYTQVVSIGSENLSSLFCWGVLFVLRSYFICEYNEYTWYIYLSLH